MLRRKSEVLQGTQDLLISKTLRNYRADARLRSFTSDSTGFRKCLAVGPGHLYPALLHPEQRGWIAAEWGASNENRKARSYSITTDRRRQLRNETENWERMVAIISRVLEGA